MSGASCIQPVCNEQGMPKPALARRGVIGFASFRKHFLSFVIPSEARNPSFFGFES